MTWRAILPKIGSVREAWWSALLLPTLFVALIYSVFHFYADLNIFSMPIDAALDQRMALTADTVRADTRITFIDFDDRTLQTLGDPPLIPIPAIARTLSGIASAKPSAIVVDLDLAYVRAPEDLALLRQTLSELATQRLPVLLVRDTLPAIGASGVRYRETPLDADVAAASNLLWVGSAPSSSDDIARLMPPVQQARLGGKPLQLPAPALALALVRRTGSVASARAAFAATMSSPQGCAPADPDYWIFCTPRGALRVLRRGGDRISYALNWPPQSDDVLARPALPLVQGKAFDASVITGRIVILGTSAGLRDRARTPLGPMPGPMIQANALHSWASRGPDRAPAYGAGLVLVTLVTAIATMLLTGILRLTPARYRPALRGWMPPLVSGVFWLTFYLGSSWSGAGLVAVVFAATSIIMFAERRLEARLMRQPFADKGEFA